VEAGTQERDVLALGMTGARWKEGWQNANGKATLHDLKEELEALLDRLGLLAHTVWKPTAHAALEQAHEVLVNGRAVAIIGTVLARLLKAHDLGQEVHFLECDEAALLELCRAGREGHTEVPRFPAVRRDLSLLIGQELRYEQLLKAAHQAERKLLKEVGLFDVYQGDKLPAGKKSYAMSFVLQDSEKTLTDEQVDKAMGRIRQALEKEFGATLRG